MSIDWYFALEILDGDRWVPDIAHAPRPTWKYSAEHRADLGWIHRRNRAALSLFINGPLAMTPQPPPDWAASRFCTYCASLGPDWLTDLRFRWIPMDELLVGEWASTRLLWSTQVPVASAPAFGGGQDPWPMAGLTAVDEYTQAEWMWAAEVATEPIDQRGRQFRTYGAKIWETDAVTYSATITEVVGEENVAAFSSAFDPAAQQRVYLYRA